MNIPNKINIQGTFAVRSLVVFDDGGLELSETNMDNVSAGDQLESSHYRHICRCYFSTYDYCNISHLCSHLYHDDFNESGVSNSRNRANRDNLNMSNRENRRNKAGRIENRDMASNNENKNAENTFPKNSAVNVVIEDLMNRKDDENPRRKLLFGARNIVLSEKNVASVSKIKDYRMYFYFGETFDNKRHGWGFLADENKIIYEGMWYLDKAVGWYLLYRNLSVEFGYLNYVHTRENSRNSYVYWDKEGEVILCNNNFDSKDHLYFEFLEIRGNLNNQASCEHIFQSDTCSNTEKLGSCLESLTNHNVSFSNSNRHNSAIKRIQDSSLSSEDKALYFICERRNKSCFEAYPCHNNHQALVGAHLTNNENRCIHNSNFLKESSGSKNSCRSASLKSLLFPPLTLASECIFWPKETISKILAYIGLTKEASIFYKNNVSGTDICSLSEEYLKNMGVSNVYRRKFILRLFRLFWSFVDYTDLILSQNKKLYNSFIPCIPSSLIQLGNYICGGAHSYIRKGIFEGSEIICKIYFFNTENYDSISLNDRFLNDDFNKTVFKSYYPEYNENENKYSNSNSFPEFLYVYRFIPESTQKTNMYKYIPTPIKMRNWEARILHYLSPHPNIVKCLGLAQIGNGYEVLLLEDCQGGSMDKYIFKDKHARLNRLSTRFSASRFELLSWMRDIATGMEHVHRLGILHRDLKLSNFFVAKMGDRYVGKVGDFGIAISTDLNADYSNFSEFGNVYYAAPEVLRGEGFYKQSDVWSFGISMYEILTNTLAFDGFFPGLTMVMNAANVPVLNDIHSTPLNLTKLLKKILNPDWKKRPSFKYVSEEMSKIIEKSERSILRRLGEFHYFEAYS